ncbi:hypothetical protein [Poseidonocella sp. HB161398]|uniref:hypothetical protein n=1 Tax=Poseidonocella sp. HB161398 TaxID=2320855 RepID=UPI001108497C|nr:hypothetical protein [Poseidonocella sp. HB161398]
MRDQLILSVGRIAGLRVEEMEGLPVAKIMALRLRGAGPAETRKLSVEGKFAKTRDVSFPVELLRQLQAYALELRDRALEGSRQPEPAGLFVVHLGKARGRALSIRGLQRAMEDLFIRAGLFELVPCKTAAGVQRLDGSGRPLLRPRARHSVHDLRRRDLLFLAAPAR